MELDGLNVILTHAYHNMVHLVLHIQWIVIVDIRMFFGKDFIPCQNFWGSSDTWYDIQNHLQYEGM